MAVVLALFRSGTQEPAGSPPANGAARPSTGGALIPGGEDGVMSREEYTRILKSLETNAEFADMLQKLQAERRFFDHPSEYTSRLSRLFEAWFAKDMAGAIAGVGMIPEDDSGSFPLSGAELRAMALLDGGVKRIPEAPEVFMKAADELLPDRLRDNNAQEMIVQQLAAADPARCLAFVEASFGQGWFKERAVRSLFSIWSNKNLVEAINAVAELAFPEDRRSGYEAVVGSAAMSSPREEQIRMLEERGLPEDLVAKLRDTERERRKRFGDPPPDPTQP